MTTNEELITKNAARHGSSVLSHIKKLRLSLFFVSDVVQLSNLLEILLLFLYKINILSPPDQGCKESCRTERYVIYICFSKTKHLQKTFHKTGARIIAFFPNVQ